MRSRAGRLRRWNAQIPGRKSYPGGRGNTGDPERVAAFGPGDYRKPACVPMGSANALFL